MAFDEDLSVFFDEDDFAVAATLNGTAAGNVIFDRDYLRQLGIVEGANPVALGQSADYDGTDVVNGTLALSGTSYTVRSREPLDDGAVLLLQLEAQ